MEFPPTFSAGRSGFVVFDFLLEEVVSKDEGKTHAFF